MELPNLNTLKEQNNSALIDGGIDSDKLTTQGIAYAIEANEVRDAGNVEVHNYLVQAAGNLIGRFTAGSLELHAARVRKERADARGDDAFIDEVDVLNSKELSDQWYTRPEGDASTINEDNARIMRAAREIHILRQGDNVMPPVELWNTPQMWTEGAASGLHPMVLFAIGEALPKTAAEWALYNEWMELDMRMQ